MTGCTLIEAYGLSETSPAVTVNPLDLKDYNGSIGLPISSTEVILRADDGREVPLGSAGEIWVRGPQVMKGYWNSPAETAKVLGPDGFLATGDIGVMDEKGYVSIVDRKKDMLIVSGFNVYPNEIEAVVAKLPGVAEWAGHAVADPRSRGGPQLFVVERGGSLTRARLRTHPQG